MARIFIDIGDTDRNGQLDVSIGTRIEPFGEVSTPPFNIPLEAIPGGIGQAVAHVAATCLEALNSLGAKQPALSTAARIATHIADAIEDAKGKG